MIDDFSGEYNFLSNFYFCDVNYEGIVYPTVEHAFQAAKTFDEKKRIRISKADTPGIAKKMGRKVKLRPDWEDVKVGIMYQLLKNKFSNTYLARGLLNTGNKVLVEGNWWNDYFWGVCKGRGKNHLGKLLMKVREDLVSNKDKNDIIK